MWRIKKFRRADGSCPVDEFLDASENRERRKVESRLRIIEQVEQIPGDWVVNYVSTDFHRLKTTGQSRVICVRNDATKEIILLTGGFKTKKSLPRAVVNQGEALLAELNRGDGSVENFEFD